MPLGWWSRTPPRRRGCGWPGAQIIQRYTARWSIEVAIEDAKGLFGVGQVRDHLALAVRRTVPFALTCQNLTMLWYATAVHHPDDVAEHRDRAPWYTTKAQPSTADMIAKLRRVLIAARFPTSHSTSPYPQESTPSAWSGHRRRVTAKVETEVVPRI